MKRRNFLITSLLVPFMGRIPAPKITWEPAPKPEEAPLWPQGTVALRANGFVYTYAKMPEGCYEWILLSGSGNVGAIA